MKGLKPFVSMSPTRHHYLVFKEQITLTNLSHL